MMLPCWNITSTDIEIPLLCSSALNIIKGRQWDRRQRKLLLSHFVRHPFPIYNNPRTSLNAGASVSTRSLSTFAVYTTDQT